MQGKPTVRTIWSSWMTRKLRHQTLQTLKSCRASSIPGTSKIYLENRRTPGASGAWNTALLHLYEIDPTAFVALLDDDDSWAETYLERCEQAIAENGLDMVAAGLVFHRYQDTETEIYHPPPSLEAGDLLVRNTHIQGSNLFVRLRGLLEAGGFDEALTSTTDRDICIRLADLGTDQVQRPEGGPRPSFRGYRPSQVVHARQRRQARGTEVLLPQAPGAVCLTSSK